MSSTIFYGAVINPTTLDACSAWPRCLLSVDATGNIDWLVEDVETHLLQDTLAAKGHVDAQVFELKDGEFIIPGFIDTHTHAPQYPNMGTGGQYQLLDWLENVTFPTEAKFADLEFAKKTYESVVRRVIDAGTTTCCYYGTLHLDATKILADVVHSYGQRAFVGKCNMDRESPSYYIEPSASASLSATQSLITHIRSFLSTLVHPILTPRFAISCTSPLLTSLGALASSDPSLRIQTHISENPSEISFTRSLFPEAPSYAGVYDAHGLLRYNTILAHAVHLSEDEMELVKRREAGISHCPTSNFNLSSGVAKVGEMLDRGIKVGLGTDVSGGFALSMLNAIQNASIASKVVSIQHRASSEAEHAPGKFANKPLPMPTLLYLATKGGAQVCNLETQVGSFGTGMSFDALFVSVREEADGNPGVWGLGLESPPSQVSYDLERKKKEAEGWLERFLFCGDDRNVRRVYVQGKLVGGKAFRS